MKKKLIILGVFILIGVIISTTYLSYASNLSPSKYEGGLTIFKEAVKIFLGFDEEWIQYDTAGLGTLVLTSSLVGLGLIITIYSGFLKRDKNLKSMEWFWMAPLVSFSYALFFSLTKLIVGFNDGVAKIDKIAIRHLSFVFLIFAIFSFIVWLLWAVIELNYNEKN